MNAEQQAAFNEVQKGSNIFLTGSAGTGKSFTLNAIVRWARSKGLDVAVTASTGCAAYLLSGRTIHSYLGIGLAKKSAKELYDYIKHKKPFILSKLRSLDVLVIDEISMINEELLSKISEFLGLVRGSSKAFGDIQIILSGDFAQLPSIEGTYCFHSKEWKRAAIITHNLVVLMRQNNDERLREILEELRWGMCSNNTIQTLTGLKHTKFPSGIIPTVLYSMNVDVEKVNNKKFTALLEKGADHRTYKTTYAPHVHVKEWASSIKIADAIHLCVGAQVVLTWNLSQADGLINGSRGVVTHVTDKGPKVKFTSGVDVVIEPYKIVQDDNPDSWISFVPLKLAYALTVHKSQGMTLDAVVLDLGDSIFEYGQAYTALSRVRNLESIRILNVKAKSFKTHKDVLAFYGKIQ